MAKQVHFKFKERNVRNEQHNGQFCCRVTYKGAAAVVVVLEALYWFYYLLILVFTIVNHRQAWSIIIVSINVVVLGVQIIIAAIGVWKENPRLLLTHLIFLILTMIWDLFITFAFFILAVYPSVKNNRMINYNGEEFNARVFGIVMGCAMLIFYLIRFVTTWIIWRYWRITRSQERLRQVEYHALSPLP